ncbi:MAG TPA: MltA domain-containing protein [Burkholderiaceae bacterium]|nr:MltA domain-containing protein [Burkholderiaceae bacterium]
MASSNQYEGHSTNPGRKASMPYARRAMVAAISALMAACAGTPVKVQDSPRAPVPAATRPAGSDTAPADVVTPIPSTPSVNGDKAAPSPTATTKPDKPGGPTQVPAAAEARPASLVTTAMVPASFADLPGWNDDDVAAAWPAFLAGCTTLRNRAEWRAVCNAAPSVNATSRWAIRKFFTDRFRPYRLREIDNSTTGLITGYYEPALRGSRSRSAQYNVPLYAAPDDLISVELGDVVPELKDVRRVRGRIGALPNGRRALVPYWTRAELMNGAGAASLKGKELVWLADPVEAFFLQVQGSGRIQLDDGRTVRMAYADTNGHPYYSIGKVLIDRHELRPEQASMQGIQAWARANPNLIDEVLAKNPSYVFFREATGGDANAGPLGTLGVPLTAERSIAVDTKAVPLGAPVFLATTQPLSSKPLRRLVMAQDTGSAIKGAVRADVYWGSGAQAGEIAGKTKQRGEMWVLLPK